jgi:hypothetical protein
VAQSGPCDSLQQLANQTAGYYRGSGDAAHRAAAQNYQNAYSACVNNTRQQATRPGNNSGAMFNALSGMLGILGSMNSGGDSAERFQAEQAARDEAARLEQEARAQAEQVARIEAEQAQYRAERAERERLAVADTRARCSARNSFGTSSGCPESSGPLPTSPFRPCPRPMSSGCDWSGTGAPSQQKSDNASRFASRPSEPLASPGTTPPPARRAAPPPAAAGDNQYDSVLKVKCPGGVQPGCIADDWRRGFALLAQHGKMVPKYKPPDFSQLVISTEQYERIGRGEATFEEVEDENYSTWINNYTANLVADLEKRLAEIREDPEALRVIERLKPRQ